jgi:ribosomal protein S18 acetylase RimI-like enzyme
LDTIQIAHADVGDAERILDLQYAAYRSEAELYDDCRLPPLTQTLPELVAELGTRTFLVARHRATIVGTVRARVADRAAHIGRLAVDPLWHGRGIGRRLLRAIEQATAPVERYELYTGHRTDRNLRMYERAGYHRIRVEQRSPTVSLVYLEKLGHAAARECEAGEVRV